MDVERTAIARTKTTFIEKIHDLPILVVTQQLIDRFCGGSVEELLVGLVDNQVLRPSQLKSLAAKIEARKGKKG